MDSRSSRKVCGHQSIRRLTPEDALSVKALADLCFSDRWTLKSFLHFLGHESGLVLGSFEEERLIAYFLSLVVCGELDVISIATHPEHRKQGHANRLIRQALSNEKVKTGFLEVATDNTPAILLYEKAGFGRAYIRQKYYQNKTDALVMNWKRLGKVDPAANASVSVPLSSE